MQSLRYIVMYRECGSVPFLTVLERFYRSAFFSHRQLKVHIAFMCVYVCTCFACKVSTASVKKRARPKRRDLRSTLSTIVDTLLKRDSAVARDIVTAHYFCRVTTETFFPSFRNIARSELFLPPPPATPAPRYRFALSFVFRVPFPKTTLSSDISAAISATGCVTSRERDFFLFAGSLAFASSYDTFMVD